MRDVTVILFQETCQTNVPKLRVQQLDQPESHVHVVNVGREESEQWTGNRRFIFLLPSSHASHSFRTSGKIPRSPRLAHKSPVLQARDG